MTPYGKDFASDCCRPEVREHIRDGEDIPYLDHWTEIPCLILFSLPYRKTYNLMSFVLRQNESERNREIQWEEPNEWSYFL